MFDSEDQRHSCSLQAICYLSSSQFRYDSGYVYDKKGIPFRIFNHDAELTLAYEPVKIPQNEDEKYDSVHCEVVALPELKVGGITGDSGWEAMINLFDVEDVYKRQALRISASAAPGLGAAMFSRIVREKRKGSCNTRPMFRRR